MHDPIVAMSPLAAEGQCAGFEIKVRSPLDQFADSLGRFADHHFDDGPIAELPAGRKRVGDVILETIFGIKHAGDASLGVGAVRFLEVVFADDQHRKLWIAGNRGPQAGQAAADDQHVGKGVRHPLRSEGDEITRGGFEHGRLLLRCMK